MDILFLSRIHIDVCLATVSQLELQDFFSFYFAKKDLWMQLLPFILFSFSLHAGTNTDKGKGIEHQQIAVEFLDLHTESCRFQHLQALHLIPSTTTTHTNNLVS